MVGGLLGGPIGLLGGIWIAYGADELYVHGAGDDDEC